MGFSFLQGGWCFLAGLVSLSALFAGVWWAPDDPRPVLEAMLKSRKAFTLAGGLGTVASLALLGIGVGSGSTIAVLATVGSWLFCMGFMFFSMAEWRHSLQQQQLEEKLGVSLPMVEEAILPLKINAYEPGRSVSLRYTPPRLTAKPLDDGVDVLFYCGRGWNCRFWWT